MRLKSISIENLKAFTEFKADLPAVALLEGNHGTGKSSIEAVICYMLGRRPLAGEGARSVQHDAGMLHGNSELGTATVTFSDDSPVEYMRVRVTPETTTRQVKTRGSKRWEDASEFIDAMTNALAYDPLQFGKLSEKQRIEAFLRIVPVQIGLDELNAAVGGVLPPTATATLESINLIYEKIYAARTVENQNGDRMAKHAAELESTLGPEPESGDWAGEVKRLRSELERVKGDVSDRTLVIRNTFNAFELSAEKVYNDEYNQIDAEINDKIRVLEEERALRKKVRSQKTLAEVSEARDETQRGIELIAEDAKPEIEDLTVKIAQAEERNQRSTVTATTKRNIEAAKTSARQHAEKSKAMTEALARLKELKATVAGRLPVKGVMIASPRAGAPVDICREEKGVLVPFSSWNSADQDGFCLRIAMLYKGPLGLVCIDNTGNWNEPRRASILATAKRYAEEQGMQFLVGMPGVGDLRISDGAKTEATA